MSWGVMSAEDHHQLGWGMGAEEGWRKGPWTTEEDRLLIEYVKMHGEGRWNSVCRLAGLKRNGKSCRLRWVNYLRPDLKRGQITPNEEKIILELHARWGNRWSTIARSLPGRTDNEIKNYWRTHFKKKAKPSSPSSDLHPQSNINMEKSKARILRRQQFLLQQQQLQQQQQQQQQQLQLQMLQTHQQTFDMNKLVSVLDETHDYMSTHHLAPANSNNMYNQYYYSSSSSSSSAADHHMFLSSMFNGYGTVPGTNNIDQETIWDGLWNLDDVNGSMNCSRNAIYHASASAAAAPFC